MEKIINNNYTVILLGICIGIYAMMAHNKLPNFIVTLFKNDIFRIIYISLLFIYKFEDAPHIALTIALIYIITLDYILKREMEENFSVIKDYKQQMKIK